MDLAHSLDLEHKRPATELGWYIKRYLDVGHHFSGPLVQNWLELLEKYRVMDLTSLHEITLKTAIFMINYSFN